MLDLTQFCCLAPGPARSRPGIIEASEIIVLVHLLSSTPDGYKHIRQNVSILAGTSIYRIANPSCTQAVSCLQGGSFYLEITVLPTSNSIREINILPMGCQNSQLDRNDANEHFNSEQFKINYRQFIMNSRGEVFDFYHFSTIVHRSSAGIIRRVFHRANKAERICKIVPVENLKELSCVQEVEVLKNLEHPNAAKIHEYFIEKHFVYKIFELIPGASLQDSLGTLKEICFSQILGIMKQLFSVVNMMHSQNIAHRSIHPGHIMLERRDSQFILKLIDFTYAAYSLSPKLKPPKPYQYEPAYTSSESETDPLKHDIYCCGLVFLTLLGGFKKIRGIRGREQAAIREILGPYPQVPKLEQLLLSLLQPKPKNRPSALQALQNELFSDNRSSPQHTISLTNLRQFNIQNRLKSTLWMFATIKLQNIYNRVELMNEFYNLDHNKDGKIQFEQLCEGLMNTFAISRQEAKAETQRIFKSIDKNNNGQMDFYEFVMGAYVVGRNLSDAELELIFNEIDVNKDGIIEAAELHEAIEGIDEFGIMEGTGNRMDYATFRTIMRGYIARLSKVDD